MAILMLYYNSWLKYGDWGGVFHGPPCIVITRQWPNNHWTNR